LRDRAPIARLMQRLACGGIMEAEHTRAWFIAAAVAIAATALGYAASAIVLARLSRWVARTATTIDDLVFSAARRHIPIWFLLAGIVVAARIAPLPAEMLALIDRGCGVLFSISLSLMGATLASRWIAERSRRSGAATGAASLIQQTVRAVILVIGLLLVLSNLGISITPLVTALGVGSLAVALALQPTLSNLFAGLHLTVARPIRVGDFVELETGGKGYVVDIGWRATRIRELPNNVVVVPNSRIVDMVLTNYALPETEQSALVQVGVAYASDLKRVEHVTVDVAREVLRDVEGGIREFEPFIRFHTFGESSIDFSVILRVREFTDRYLVTHEFIKRLKTRYEQEGIEIPFPQRTVHGQLSMLDRVAEASGGHGVAR
jgi:small-conductance mechanosensitive channel